MIKLNAHAKINLTLEILGKRPDGYHEVATILQAIDLKDTLTFERAHKLSLECDTAELRSEDNLALWAAKLLHRETGSQAGAAIHLAKGIPVASGLGGGASDAAATLKALSELWGLNLPRDRLLELAPSLGSDVAFFLYGGTALAEGRGEQVTPLPAIPESWVVILKPPIEVPPNKTQSLYNRIESSHFSSGLPTRQMADSIRRGHAPTPSMLSNAFDSVAFSVYAGMEGYWQRFRELGAANVHLAGSGPALFTIAPGEAEAEAIYKSLMKEGLEAYLVPTVSQR